MPRNDTLVGPTFPFAGGSNESLVRNVVHDSLVPTLVTTIRGDMPYVNRAFASLIGYEPEGLIGLDLLRFVHRENAPTIRDLLANLGTRPIEAHQAELRFLRKDGTTVWVSAAVAPLIDEKTGARYATIQAINIDVQKRAEADIARLRSTEDRLQFANTLLTTEMETSPDGILVVDATSKIISFNRRFAEMWKIPLAVLQAKEDGPVLAAVTSSMRDPDAFVERVRYLYAHPEVAGHDELETKDGRFIERHTGILRTSTGDYLGRVWFFRDITEKIARAKAQELQNLRFDAALSNMTQGLCMFDRDKRLVVSNRQYAAMYKLKAEDVRPGMLLEEILRQRLAAGNQPLAGSAEFISKHLAIASQREAVAFMAQLADGREISIRHQPLADGGWVATHEDITEQRRIEARIQHLAGHDPLTDLPNRSFFQSQLEQVSGKVDRRETAAVLCIDLDGFKGVNDALGHSAGDALLKEVAGRFVPMIRETDVVARLGGDEFAILANGLDQAEDAAVLAARIVEVMAQPFYVEGHHVVIGASVGIAVAPVDGRDGATLVKHADLALYRAKAGGRGTYHFYEKGLDAALQERRAIETALRGALVRDEFRLVFQPLINLKENRICSFEALLRWQHPERGYLEPAQFIPVAEESGLIVPIGEWVLQQACAAAVAWPEGTSVAVNLSPVQFRKNRHIVDHVKSALANSGLRPDRLELEITESVLLADSPLALDTLRQLKEVGVKIAMDDFGTGYSSLSYLRRFPFDKIKIDQSFVRDSSASQDSLAIVKAVIGLGRSLGMTTTAEGVETEAQLDMIREQGCTEVQGFLLSAPLPASAVTELLSRTGSAKADGTMRASDVA